MLEENFKSFQGDLAIEEEVLVVQDEQQCCSTGLEVFQVTTFDAKGAVATLIGNVEGMVVDLALLASAPDDSCSLPSSNIPGHEAREAVARMAGRMCCYLQTKYQPQVQQAQQMQWQPSYLVTSNCRVECRVYGSFPRKASTPSTRDDPVSRESLLGSRSPFRADRRSWMGR